MVNQHAKPGGGLTRRGFIGAAGATAAAVSLPTAVAQAAPRRRSSGLSRIEHIVVFMQENRSYDHYFGAYRGAARPGDRLPRDAPAGPAEAGRPVGLDPPHSLC
jgi:phospholipase C